MALDTLLLVRHDLTNANSGFIQGQTDTDLVRGFKTRIDGLTDLIAQEEIDHLQKGGPIYVISSDLGRTYGTAERIMHRLWDRHGYQAELRFTEDLKERGQGDIEGKSFEEALPLLSSDHNLTPDAETIYRLLYLSNSVPNGETHEAVTARLERFVRDYVQQLQGTGIVVTHLISGMNCLQNLLRYGNTLGIISGGPPQPYQHRPNLSVVRLEPDPTSFMRYKETGSYGPPNNHAEVNGALAKR